MPITSGTQTFSSRPQHKTHLWMSARVAPVLAPESLSLKLSAIDPSEGTDTSAFPRVSTVACHRPTGRYVYESSSDEDEDTHAEQTHSFSDDSEDDTDLSTRHDTFYIRLANELDSWDRWDQASARRAWKHIHRVRSNSSAHVSDSSVDEIDSILAQFQLQQREIECKEREAFEQRNKSLWEGIEAAIRQAEQREVKEAEQLAAARKRQEQAEADAKRAREAELKRIEEEQRAAKEKALHDEKIARKRAESDKREGEQNAMRGGPHIWPLAAAEFRHWEARMRYIKQDVLPSVAARPDWRKQCFTAKRTITPKIGQLTNSSSEIARITASIHDVLQQARSVPDADASKRLYYWMLNHLSKCLIRQAEQEVAARQETAFPLARVAMGLMLQGHDTLGEVFVSRLVKKCPWILGYLPERKPTMEESVYRKQLGFKDDADESVHMYMSRMAGITALYFACLQTSLENVAACSGLPTGVSLVQAAQSVPETLRASRLWLWAVRSTTAPLLCQPLITTLWCTFLEICGSAFLVRYGRQARKVLSLVLEQGVRGEQLGLTENSDDATRNALRSARVRLQLILESWQNTGLLREHATLGRVMDN